MKNFRFRKLLLLSFVAGVGFHFITPSNASTRIQNPDNADSSAYSNAAQFECKSETIFENKTRRVATYSFIRG